MTVVPQTINSHSLTTFKTYPPTSSPRHSGHPFVPPSTPCSAVQQATRPPPQAQWLHKSHHKPRTRNSHLHSSKPLRLVQQPTPTVLLLPLLGLALGHKPRPRPRSLRQFTSPPTRRRSIRYSIRTGVLLRFSRRRRVRRVRWWNLCLRNWRMRRRGEEGGLRL